jgi:uncharacterized protein YggE
MKNAKALLWTVGLLPFFMALVALLVSCVPSDTSVAGEVPEVKEKANISVVGFGEALGKPDEAQVTVGVDTFAPVVTDATAENEATIAAILDSLDQAGISAEDIQTSNYSLWAEQKYGDNGPEGIAGYRISNQVMVLIRDVTKVEEVLAAATAAGANSIYGVQFSVADPAALQAEAREQALQDARQRAETLANLSGMTVGDIQIIDEINGQIPGYGGYLGLGGGGGGAMEAGPSINPGQLSYQVQVQVTYNVHRS